MATNSYFAPSYFSIEQQTLLSGLHRECIQQQGYDVYYMPRELTNFDYLFGEDVASRFSNAIPIEAYIKSFEGHSGEQDIISKFGLDIRDDMEIQIHQGRFAEEITSRHATIKRPREGDLIFFALDRGISIFEIAYAENEIPFYQLGEQYLFDIKMKRFVYSAEQIETGNTVIDAITEAGATTVLVLGTSATPTVKFVAGEFAYQSLTNLAAATASGIVISHIGTDLSVRNVNGIFVGNQNIKGSQSNADWTYPVKNDTTHVENANNPVTDNLAVKQESATVVDYSELNPFVDF